MGKKKNRRWKTHPLISGWHRGLPAWCLVRQQLCTEHASVPTSYAGGLAVVAVSCCTASGHLSFVSLQRQLSKNIKFGQPPPNAIPMKKADSGEGGLEEDLFLTSPMEAAAQQDVLRSDTEHKVRLLQAMT